MELLSVFNKNEQFMNKYIKRGIKPNGNDYIIIVYLFIHNEDDKYLLERDIKSNKWVVPGGHVISAIPLNDLNREIKEELGIDIYNEKITNIGTIINDNYILKLHLLEKNIIINDIICDFKEVKEVKYFSLKEIEQLIINKKLKENNIIFINKLKEFNKGLYEKNN